MRIALVSVPDSPVHQVTEGARELAGRGHEVRVFTRRSSRAEPPAPGASDRVVVERVPVGPAQRLSATDLLRHAGGFGRWLARRWSDTGWRPDVVHAHSWLSGLAAVTATRAATTPVVQTYHTLGTACRRCLGPADRSPRERVGLERALGRVVDQVVAESRDEVTELTHLGLAREEISVVPAGVDPATFSPLGASHSATRILAVGSSSPASGLDETVAALRLVPGAELVIVGGGESGRLRMVADRCGVADRVRLVGDVPAEEMPEWYRSAAVLCCTPRCPVYGLPAVEAMACGTPVVGYAHGGLADTVVDGLTGRLVRPHDVPAVAAALRQLLGGDVERLAYAQAAVDRARACYAWDRVAGELEQLYGQVCREAGSLSHRLPG